MNAEQQRVSSILLDSLALLCKNSLTFSTELTVQGLIGITVDKENVFLVHINERFVPDGAQSIKQEPYYEDEYANPDIQPEPFRKERNKKLGAKSRRFHAAEDAVPERGFGRDVKCEAQYEGYDDYAYADRAENQAAYADVKPLSVTRQMQVTYGGRGRPTAVTSTIVTESYDMIDADCAASRGVAAETVDDDAEDVPWASEDDLMEFPPGQPHQEFVPNQRMWKPNSASRGFKSKRAVRGRASFVRGNQGMQPPRMGAPKAPPPPGVGRLKVSQSNPYVINETSHLCGYPNCGKRFRFRHDLLRHQTKKHGRTPVSRGRGSSMSYGFEDYE